MSTINIHFGVNQDVASFLITSVLRSDTGLAPAGISLPITLTKGSPSSGIWPWTGSFTDTSPPPYYNALGTINGIDTPPLTIPGVGTSPSNGFTVVLGTNYQTIIPLVLPQNTAPSQTWTFVDGDGNPVVMTGKTIHFTAWQSADGGQTKQTLFTRSTGGSGVTVVGAYANGVQVAFTQSNTAQLINEWAQYDITVIDTETQIADGPFSVSPAFQ